MDIREELRNFYSYSLDYLTRLKFQDKFSASRYVSFMRKYAWKGAKILDVGCGIGLSTFLLAQEDYKVIGVDISSLLIKEAMSRSNPNVKFIVGDVLNLPFSNSSFDVVTSYYLLEHIPDVERALSEMVRVLKKGGLLLIRSPNLLSPYTSLLKFLNILIGRKRSSSLWGKTTLESSQILLRNSYYSLRKIVKVKTNFIYRQPELNVRENDADSVCLLNQMDLKNFFKRKGFKLLNVVWARSRWRRLLSWIFSDFAPSIGFVVRKL